MNDGSGHAAGGRKMWRGLAAALACSLLAACAPFQPETGPGAPPVAAPGDRGLAIAQTAVSQLGAPYRYGGAGPDGFDCSGLVNYAYRSVGISVPRTAADLYAASRRIDKSQLRPGDLVFFKVEAPKVSHVGIYVGQGRFVHAPQTGRAVSEATLDQPFYAARFAGAGRLVPGIP